MTELAQGSMAHTAASIWNIVGKLVLGCVECVAKELRKKTQINEM